MEKLAILREKARELDAELMRLLHERMSLTDSMAPLKVGMPVYDPAREADVVRRVRETAASLGISPAMAEAVIRTVMAESRLRQDSSDERSNISLTRYLPPPQDFMAALPRTAGAAATVEGCRSAIRDILDGKDERILLVMGPCSIHDPAQALEYARGMSVLAVDRRFLPVMRTYVEKPRSGAGWTGFLADPRLDGSGDVQEGITATRKLLIALGEMGIPTAVEFINPLVPAYIGDLVSWGSVGARSSGSQLHRDMASGLPMPVGFKNGLDGDISSLVGAVNSAGMGHDFLGLDANGSMAAFKTSGNAYCHPVLRGGPSPNYDSHSIEMLLDALAEAGLRPGAMVDCGHGNSGKVAASQAAVFMELVGRIAAGEPGIMGLMLESNLLPGRQDPGPGMRHGISITDECLGWDETAALVREGCRAFG